MAKRRAKGEGSIFFDNHLGYWVAKITLDDGKTKKKRAKTQQEVRDWLIDQRKAQRDNLLLKDERITLGDHLDHFMSDVASHNLAPSTIHSYNYLIRDHIKPSIGHIRLVNLTPKHLQSLYSAKLKQGLSERTVQYIHAVLRRSLNEAVKWGMLYRNPTDATSPPRPRQEPPTTLSVEQAKLFLESVEDHSYYPIYLLAITTGMRKGEILGLQWEDVELDKGTISIRRTLVDIQGKMHLGQPKSDSAKRTISLPEKVCEVFKMFEMSEGYVFKTSTGNPISQRNLTRHFHTALEKAGLPKTSFHTLRHTAATILLQANVHPKVVQEMLGHSTITLTLDTYSHVIPGHHDEAANEMDRIFG